jgi:hypothetical protein
MSPEEGYEDTDWIVLAQDKEQSLVPVSREHGTEPSRFVKGIGCEGRGSLTSRMTLGLLLHRITGQENRDYGRRGSAALTMRHPSIRKSWY